MRINENNDADREIQKGMGGTEKEATSQTSCVLDCFGLSEIFFYRTT